MNIVSRVFEPVLGSRKQEYHYDAEESSDNASDAQNNIGAPVEQENPLGYNLDYVTAFYTVITGIIGTGIFLTPGSIIKSINSIGASYVLWVSGFLIALFEVFVYIEYVTYFSKRSGGDVAYLEQAYPKPDFLVPTTYAAVSVILSFLNSSAVAFGTYVLKAAGAETSAWNQRGIGVAALTFAALMSAFNTRWTLRLSNLLGFVKVVFMLFIIISGFVVLGGGTRVSDPHSIFKNAWEGTTTDGNAISNAIIKVSFSYGGTQYVFAMVGESHPKQTKTLFRYFIPFVIFFVFVLYILIITAFYAGIGSVEEIRNGGTLIASLYFQKVFGTKSATSALDALVALSSLGHLLAAVVGHSRSLRECGRQGVLPFSRLWATTKPWGTPLVPIFFTWLVNVVVSVAPPPGDAYNVIVDIGSYSGYIFKLLLVVGLLLVRRQRKQQGLGYNGWKVPLPILVIIILFYAFVIAMAWVPPADGSLKGSDVSFFYATYAIVCVGILSLCVLYYYIWAKVLPYFFHYEHRTIHFTLENGETGHTVVKVPTAEVAKFDAEHDDNGRYIGNDSASNGDNSVQEVAVSVHDKK